MTSLKTLEGNITKWAGEMNKRRERLEFVRGEIDRIVREVVDAKTDDQRGMLRVTRAGFIAELDALEAELREVTRRYDVAVEAARAYKIQQAENAYKSADQTAREKRALLMAAQDAKHRFMNQRGKQTDASVKRIRDMDIAIATAQAELTIADREKARAGGELQALRA